MSHKLRLLAVLVVSCATRCLAQQTSESWLQRFSAPNTDQIVFSDDAERVLLKGLPGPLSEPSLAGVVDIHAHCDPDSVPRSIDALDLVRLAHDRGMRALVLKNHSDPTASLAYLVRKEIPGIEVFGGIVLNRTVGGINPAAVGHLPAVKGGWGRVVWMPTNDAENQVRYSKENRPFVPVSHHGNLLPEVQEVLRIIAKHRLVLATGHSSATEDLMLIRAARSAGVESIVVTHPMSPPVNMSIGEMKEAAALGAYLEFTYSGLLGPGKPLDLGDYVTAIRAVGPEHCILSSDLGQPGNPLHPDGWVTFLQELQARAFTQQEIGQMSKVNPAKLLNLP